MSAVDTPWQIELLGWLRARRGDRLLTRFRTWKTGALLAYLALHPERSHPRERLGEMFWPDASTEAGRHSLRQALSSLRRQLEPSGIERGSVLVADRHALRLNPAAFSTDVQRFRAAVSAAPSAPTDEERAAVLTEAVAAYRGELLPALYMDWVLSERDRLASVFLQSLEALSGVLERTGDLAGALECVERAIATDPLVESFHRRMMHLQLAAGRAAEAERHYLRLERLLARELDTEPEPETRDLARQASRQRRGFAVTSATPPTWQSESPSESRLPRRTSRFFGRADELARLRDMVAAADTALVTVTGPPGVGKTRLALEHAYEVAGAAIGGVWLVPLAGLSDPALVVDAVLGALSVRDQLVDEPIDRIAAALGGAPALVVLDSFEHLVDGGAAAVRLLLDRCASLKCVVTSRRRLGVPGERELPLAPLPIPRSSDSLENLARCASLQLFIDRAQAVRPDFALTRDNAADLTALCRRLEGLPLSLELAAARSHVLAPAQMCKRIDSQIEWLADRRPLGPGRHRSLRSAIEWSVRLLRVRTRQLFTQLSVFRGPFTEEAVTAVCEQPDALDQLQHLVECSLLQSSPDSEGGTVRHTLMSSVREVADGQTAPESRTVLRDRHAAYHLLLAERAAAALRGGEQRHCLDRLEREHDDLRAALQWSAESGDLGTAMRLGAALSRFWAMRGHLAEGRRRLESLLAQKTPGLSAREAALDGAAFLALSDGDPEAAGPMLAESLELRRKRGDRLGEARSLTALGLLAAYQGDYDRARRELEASAEVCRELDAQLPLASALLHLSSVLRRQGDYRGAESILDELPALFSSTGHSRGLAMCINARGRLAFERGEWEAARRHFDESLAMARQLDDKLNIAHFSTHVARLHREEGDTPAARRLLEESLHIAREAGTRRGVADALAELAGLACEDGQLADAERWLGDSVLIFERMRMRAGIARTRLGLGTLKALQGKIALAQSHYGRSLSMARAMGEKLMIAGLLEHLAVIEDDLGRACRLARGAAALRLLLGTPRRPSEQRRVGERVAALIGGGSTREPIHWEEAVEEALAAYGCSPL